MRSVVVFFLVIMSVITLIWYYNRPILSSAINPLISSESITLSSVSGETMSDVAVSCVLTYGTFFVSQQDCDELISYESSSSAESTAISCKVESGTFLVSERECAILSAAQGSQDVMDRVDE
jgi:hypothetical protein